MSKKKRKTLPTNFQNLIEVGDIGALKAVFDDRDVNAYYGYNKTPALSSFKIPDELVRWLVERGADIDARDSVYGRTPLYEQAGYWCGNVELFLELGADVNVREKYGHTPLHAAADHFRAGNVRSLLAHGADVHAKNDEGRTPLGYMLGRGGNADISNMAEIAELLLEAGAAISPDMRKSVERIGKDFEFHREAFNSEMLAKTNAGLTRLYELFDVKPAPRRRVHDGVSPITVTAARWRDAHDELWNYLVPSQGAARTVQGEVIRVTGRVSHEVLGNGGCNWDADFRKMLDALLAHFASGTPLPAEDLAEATALAARVRPKGYGDEEPGRLCELAVRWVAANPAPASLRKTDYKR
ncbi:MAG: ankyrin repeat domain-containing protein [Synergistaceae bacterium]|nr:ankyrin repeat domain-containing protein [Synergistaceae bacterium]